MKDYDRILLENKAWAKEQVEKDPHFFERLVDVQRPDFLWIGCSDSRISPNEVTQTQPGEIFIHRNVANVVVHTDLNLMSVLQYAVEVLQVKHVVVCGHYGCGGVKAALTNNSYGIIDKWLRHIKDVYRLHQAKVDQGQTEEERADLLVECSVHEQVYHLAQSSIIQKAWKRGNQPHLHGWVYSLHDGIIRPLLEIAPGSPLDHPIYEYRNLKETM